VKTLALDGAAITFDLAPDGKRLVAASRRGRVWDLDPSLTAPGPSWEAGSPVSAVAFLGGDGLVATGGSTIQFWDRATGRALLSIASMRGQVRSLQHDAHTGDLYAADENGSVLVLGLSDLHRQLRDLGLAMPGFGL
jgi:hypothetical protein